MLIFEPINFLNWLMMYNWQLKNWPSFSYDRTVLTDLSRQFAVLFGELGGLVLGISEEEKERSVLKQMISEAMKTSEIEGEYMSREEVMSSIRNHLGLNVRKVKIKDKKAENIGRLMADMRLSFSKKLTEKQIKDWHNTLFSDIEIINSGTYRKGKLPMRVISGAYGKETVHFEAPPSAKVSEEMRSFVQWYNDFAVSVNDFTEILIKTSVAHLYFETIHPFEDGNGRIGRALAEKCLFQSLHNTLPVSISTIIEKEKKEYYRQLKKAQSSLEVTEWIQYFSLTIIKAFRQAKEVILFTVKKANFFLKYGSELNDRQQKVLKKMTDNEIFKGGMTAKKYMSITKTSKATATRDLQDLFDKGVLIMQGKGRNVNYQANI